MIRNMFSQKTRLLNYQSKGDGSRLATLTRGGNTAKVVLDIAESVTPKISSNISKSGDGLKLTIGHYRGSAGSLSDEALNQIMTGGPLKEVEMTQYKSLDQSTFGRAVKATERLAVAVAGTIGGGTIGATIGSIIADIGSTALGDGNTDRLKDRSIANGVKVLMADTYVRSGDLESALKARDEMVEAWERKNGTLTDSQRLAVENITVQNGPTGTLTVL